MTGSGSGLKIQIKYNPEVETPLLKNMILKGAQSTDQNEEKTQAVMPQVDKETAKQSNDGSAFIHDINSSKSYAYDVVVFTADLASGKEATLTSLSDKIKQFIDSLPVRAEPEHSLRSLPIIAIVGVNLDTTGEISPSKQGAKLYDLFINLVESARQNKGHISILQPILISIAHSKCFPVEQMYWEREETQISDISLLFHRLVADYSSYTGLLSFIKDEYFIPFFKRYYYANTKEVVRLLRDTPDFDDYDSIRLYASKNPNSMEAKAFATFFRKGGFNFEHFSFLLSFIESYPRYTGTRGGTFAAGGVPLTEEAARAHADNNPDSATNKTLKDMEANEKLFNTRRDYETQKGWLYPLDVLLSSSDTSDSGFKMLSTIFKDPEDASVSLEDEDEPYYSIENHSLDAFPHDVIVFHINLKNLDDASVNHHVENFRQFHKNATPDTVIGMNPRLSPHVIAIVATITSGDLQRDYTEQLSKLHNLHEKMVNIATSDGVKKIIIMTPFALSTVPGSRAFTLDGARCEPSGSLYPHQILTKICLCRHESYISVDEFAEAVNNLYMLTTVSFFRIFQHGIQVDNFYLALKYANEHPGTKLCKIFNLLLANKDTRPMDKFWTENPQYAAGLFGVNLERATDVAALSQYAEENRGSATDKTLQSMGLY